MTEMETQITRKTPQAATAPEKPQEKAPRATPPLKEPEKRQETVGSEGAAIDSTIAREKPADKEQRATPPLKEPEIRQESVGSEDTVTDSTKTGALVQAAKVIEEGAELVGEKAPEVVSVVIHTIKKGVSATYGTSSTLVRGAYHAASDYADKYKHKNEMKKLKAQRQAMSSTLGSIIYTRFIIDGEPPEKVFPDQEITSLLQQIQGLDNEVVRIGKELEKY
jgi:hypothetical protein